eukprot:CAMPEP_0181211528 /NCGR_PEP_ID=MMETSP1096-20121128/23833_1 /TAXON_ID=156174 ORGANISM="Chrysochromulina ericina, Strain CCMP281" /NCGR_SAMPLE_ID=MMETSP1096 /ASSEMBLY_ACC=CAM_ASM_000453 /LENGTH=121 /DNA_ID=CAMNT_0023302933 /DNA_START=235 /DNA_END=600 /DNA_ORIENTATION=-
MCRQRTGAVGVALTASMREVSVSIVSCISLRNANPRKSTWGALPSAPTLPRVGAVATARLADPLAVSNHGSETGVTMSGNSFDDWPLLRSARKLVRRPLGEIASTVTSRTAAPGSANSSES